VNLKTSEHASSRYGYVDPTVRRFAPDTRADRCALILKRILRCCPSEDSSIRLALDQSPRAHQTCSVTRQSLFLGMDRTLPGNHPLCSRNNAATRVVFEGKLQNNVLLAEHLRCLGQYRGRFFACWLQTDNVGLFHCLLGAATQSHITWCFAKLSCRARSTYDFS
jgi:hypothetical protein